MCEKGGGPTGKWCGLMKKKRTERPDFEHITPLACIEVPVPGSLVFSCSPPTEDPVYNRNDTKGLLADY
jgi:hypothetical protein